MIVWDIEWSLWEMNGCAYRFSEGNKNAKAKNDKMWWECAKFLTGGKNVSTFPLSADTVLYGRKDNSLSFVHFSMCGKSLKGAKWNSKKWQKLPRERRKKMEYLNTKCQQSTSKKCFVWKEKVSPLSLIYYHTFHFNFFFVLLFSKYFNRLLSFRRVAQTI